MTKDFPLTKQQLALWIEQRLHPNNTSYNTCVKVKLTGDLEVKKFLNATTEVIQFFDTLKVYFVEQDGLPIQRIDEDASYVPEFIDLSDGALEETREKKAEAKKCLSDKLNTAIDLTQFPIMRASLIKTAENVFYFIGMVPHIVSDGRAAILYLESLSVAYNRGRDGLVEEYGQTKKDWSNYLEDGLHLEHSEIQQASKEHWQQRLKNANHFFDYSYGKQLVDPDDKRGERVYFDLSEETSLRLKKHCKQQRTTLFNVFVCAFSIFIHKYYQLTDILIGYPVNIRPPGYKHFFGFFVNILPIRVDMKDNPTYTELLKRIHAVRKEDKKHQKYPALDIVADIREKLPDFDGRVFNLSMAQTVSRLFNLQLDHINSKPLDSDYYDVNDDFSLSYELIENRIGLWFEYRKALFDRSFINQAMQHIEFLIKQLLNQPDTRISQFQLLDAAEKKRLIAMSQYQSSSKNELADSQVISQLFERQVDISPNNIAISDGDRSLSYAQLDSQSNQMARQIQLLIGKKPQAVAVSLERSADLIVCLLAILKAGCFYVPLPKSYPKTRKQLILKEVSASLWIGSFDSGNQTISSSISKLDINWYNREKNGFSEQRLSQPILKVQTAYVIYTSGSSGQPKGVELTHENVTSRLNWLKQYFKLGDSDVMLQNTDFSFDVSVAEIFWPLISGAKLVVSDQHKSRDPQYLLSLIEDNNINCVCLVPSLLRVLISNEKHQQLKSLKHVLSAGEALSISLKDLFYGNSSTSNAILYNFYGPTEAAIYASFEKIENKKSPLMTIGKALGHTQLYVLDQGLDLVPVGVVGGLYVGGRGVAKGYFNNKELSQQQFIQNPYSDDEQDNIYATGDLARLGSDGRIEYLGRNDQQIKIRGFRVELLEIENTIAACSSVKDLIVTIVVGNNNVEQLVAYLVFNEADETEHSIQIESIKKAIVKQLPNYMMPSLFVSLKSIPRLNSGKIDRKLLPSPQVNAISSGSFVSASTQNERTLVDIWSQILSMDANSLSINSSFFDLGGDSLMAIQFVGLAKQKGLYFDIGDLFELRTIFELANVARAVESSDAIERRPSVSGSYGLLPRQAKFFADDFKNRNHWNRTFSFEVDHQLNQKSLMTAIRAVLTQHDNLRVKFVKSDDGTWLQYSEPVSKVDKLLVEILTIFDYTGLVNNKVANNKVANSQFSESIKNDINRLHQQIDLSKAPLIRIAYFKTNASQGKLAIIFHHLLLDMVSSRIIFEDLTSAYQSARNDLPIQLPVTTSSVKDWVAHLQERLSDKMLTNSLNYWTEFPRQACPALPVFQKRKGGDLAALEADARVKMFYLDKQSTQKILVDLINVQAMPIQDFLLACLFEVISDWTDSNAMTVNTCGHGRQVFSKDFDLSRTVGWLNTVYPVYLHLPEKVKPSSLDCQSFLSNIQQQLSKVPTDNISYNLLRYIDRNPLITRHQEPKLFFNYVGQIDSIIPKGAPFIPALDLPGVSAIASENHLCYQLYFEAGVVAGQLMFRLTYSDQLFSLATINSLTEKLISTMKNRLNGALADHA